MKDLLERFAPNFGSIIQAPVSEIDPNIGWHSTVLSKTKRSMGGGTHARRDTSLRIAIAECLERAIVSTMRNDDSLCDAFLLREFPTTCGFAFGFEEPTTRMRSIAEACERWAWHHWIDRRRPARIVKPEMVVLSPLAAHLARDFDSLLFFEQELVAHESGDSQGRVERPLAFLAVVGIAKGGAFPGSRVSAIGMRDWEHPLLEAWRHLQIFRHGYRPEIQRFLSARIDFFGRNAERAVEAMIATGDASAFGKANLRLVRKFNLLPEGAYLYRSICDDFVPWNEGDERRFVY